MTELQHAAKAASTRPRIQPAEEGDGRPLSISARLGRLQFHQSGKFRVLQFTDIQDGPKVSKDTVKLIEASLDATRPDIVIFTGNQIAGYDAAYSQTMRKRRWNKAQAAVQSSAERYEEALRQTRSMVRSTIEQLVRPLADRSVPWAVTFGNHDFQCGLDNVEVERICQEFPGCLNPAPTETSAGEKAGMLSEQRVYGCEPGTFALPVMNVDRTCNVLGLVLVDWAIMRVRAAMEARPWPHCVFWPMCRMRWSRNRRRLRRLGRRRLRRRRCRAWYSSILRFRSIMTC